MEISYWFGKTGICDMTGLGFQRKSVIKPEVGNQIH